MSVFRKELRHAQHVRDVDVAGSNPVIPTIYRKKPFGENVEGLSHFADKSCIHDLQFKQTISRMRRFVA
jgi:hypothetical protein